jgi:hypothetical protein
MISKGTFLRLKRLEVGAMPAGEPMVIEVRFVSVEKVVTNTRLVEIPQRAHNQGARGPATKFKNTYR